MLDEEKIKTKEGVINAFGGGAAFGVAMAGAVLGSRTPEILWPCLFIAGGIYGGSVLAGGIATDRARGTRPVDHVQLPKISGEVVGFSAITAFTAAALVITSLTGEPAQEPVNPVDDDNIVAPMAQHLVPGPTMIETPGGQRAEIVMADYDAYKQQKKNISPAGPA